MNNLVGYSKKYYGIVLRFPCPYQWLADSWSEVSWKLTLDITIYNLSLPRPEPILCGENENCFVFHRLTWTVLRRSEFKVGWQLPKCWHYGLTYTNFNWLIILIWSLVSWPIAIFQHAVWLIVICLLVVWSHVIGPIVQQHRRTLIGL